MKRVHEENSIMSELFSHNNMLLCGMQINNSCSSHRIISVKIETFLAAEQNFALCLEVDYLIFSINVLHSAPKY